MAQPTARHEGDQDSKERTAVSQTPCQAAPCAQPRSMPAPSAHRDVGHAKRRRSEDGWVIRGLRLPQQPPTSVQSPFRCAPSPPPLTQTLLGFKKSDCDATPPCPYFLPISKQLQPCSPSDSKVHIWTGSVKTLTDPPGCQILCCAAVLWQRHTVAGWHAGSAAGGFRRAHHHTQVPSQRGGGGVLSVLYWPLSLAS